MKLLASLVMVPLVFFASCGTGQKLQDSAPVAIKEASFQKWVAGAAGAGSGINFVMELKETPKDISFKDVYFRGMKAELVTKPKDVKTFRGYFKTDFNTQDDFVMDADPKKEFGNKPPKEKEEIPFELKDNEAVVSYLEDGKTLFYKISNVKETKVENYPSVPQ